MADARLAAPPVSGVTSTAIDPVQAATLGGSAAPPDLSIVGLFLHADWVGKGVIISLALASIWSWAIIFEKAMAMKRIRAKGKNFEHDFWASEALDKFYEKTKKRAPHPYSVMFLAAMEEWFRSKGNATTSRAAIRERVMQIMNVARNREIEKMESGLSFLATIGSSAPFIGLFGTVWGIMNSFHSIALSKNTSIAAVAPGISEALFATAIGLATAIPAYIAYNKFSRDIGQFSGRLDDFGTEFNTILSRQIEG